LRIMDISKHIEATLLKVDCSWDYCKDFVENSIKMGFIGVCITPPRVREVKELLKGTGVKLVSVCDFPFGYEPADVKKKEAEKLFEIGCDEVDMVMNIQRFKDGRYEEVRREIEEVVKVANGKVVKVIIECGLLTESEIMTATNIVCDSGANFVKTSTGFLSRGVRLSDIRLIKRALKGDVKIKASGGIRSRGYAEILISMGVERLGTSRPFDIIKEENK